MSVADKKKHQDDHEVVIKINLALISGKAAFIVSAVIALIAIFIYYPSTVGDYDLWWHFALGKYYVDNLTMSVDHSIFSWTKADPNWIYNTWLGSLLMYLAYKFAGGLGLWLLQWILLSALLLAAYLFIRRLNLRFDINYLMLFFLVLVGLNLTAIFVKPENFTNLMFGLTVLIYLYAKAKGDHRLYYLFPPLMTLWCNLHGGFLAGLLFLTITYFAELAAYIIMPKKATISTKMLKVFTIILPLSYLATLVNPYGVNYHLSIYNSLTNELYTKYSSKVFAYLSMWQFVIPKGTGFPIRFLSTSWAMILLLSVQVLLFIHLYIKKRSLDMALIALVIFFFFFGMSSGRYTLFFLILSLFTVPYLTSKTDVSRFKASYLLSALIITAFSALILWFSIFYIPDKKFFGSVYDEKRYLPYGSSEFLLKNKIEGPIFNDYLIGGYLMWSLYPQYKVFIDPRYGPFWQEVGPDYFNLIENFTSETFTEFYKKYPFKVMVLHMREAAMAFALLQGGDWKLVYLDICSVVLIHKSLVPTLSPETLATDVSPRRFRDVDSPDALTILFNFYINAGPQFGYEILKIYEANVSILYKGRDAQIAQMKEMIRDKEAKTGIKVLPAF